MNEVVLFIICMAIMCNNAAPPVYYSVSSTQHPDINDLLYEKIQSQLPDDVAQHLPETSEILQSYKHPDKHCYLVFWKKTIEFSYNRISTEHRFIMIDCEARKIVDRGSTLQAFPESHSTNYCTIRAIDDRLVHAKYLQFERKIYFQQEQIENLQYNLSNAISEIQIMNKTLLRKECLIWKPRQNDQMIQTLQKNVSHTCFKIKSMEQTLLTQQTEIKQLKEERETANLSEIKQEHKLEIEQLSNQIYRINQSNTNLSEISQERKLQIEQLFDELNQKEIQLMSLSAANDKLRSELESKNKSSFVYIVIIVILSGICIVVIIICYWNWKNTQIHRYTLEQNNDDKRFDHNFFLSSNIDW